MIALQLHPVLGLGPEERREAQRRVRRDRAATSDDLADAVGGYGDGGTEAVGRQSERFHEGLAQDPARVHRHVSFGH